MISTGFCLALTLGLSSQSDVPMYGISDIRASTIETAWQGLQSGDIRISTPSTKLTVAPEPLIAGTLKLTPPLARMSGFLLTSGFYLAPQSVSEPKLPKAPKPVKTAVESRVQGVRAVEEILCSINAVNTDLSQVLQSISKMTDVNLMLLASEDTKLTLRLADIRLIELLNHICALTNLKFLKVGSTFVIATEKQLEAGYPKEWAEAHPNSAVANAPSMSTYIVNYVDGEQIVKAIKDMFGERLSVALGPAPSTPSSGSRDTQNVTGLTSGVIRSNGETTKGRIVVLMGSAGDIASALEVAKRLDYERPQVSIRVTIHDISNDALKEVGASWTFSDLAITENASNKLIGSFTRAPLSFAATMKFLESTNKAKLMAAPSVSLLDGERAFVLIGSRISYPVLIGYSNANTPIYDKQEERVGIYLQVAASVGDGGKITLNIYPQVSTITGYLQVNGASYPQVATREAQTVLRVDSGETIVMAGLLRDEDIHQFEKVPVLADIPLLGELFRRRKTTKVSSQVIISITPIVITSENK